MKFRDLTKNDIDVRVATVNEKGASLLLYKDARVDMDILDETVGAENWQREHYDCKGNLFCRVGIKCGDEWVWKADCGTESNTEAQKGEASDSFKRACFNWGIGRELYTSPFIWVPADKCNITKNPRSGNYQTTDKFTVSEIEIRNKQIVKLQIYNATTKAVCFSFGGKTEAPKATPSKATDEKPKDIICTECGKKILPILKGGKTYTAEEIVSSSKTVYGRQMCWDCSMKEKAKRNEGSAT